MNVMVGAHKRILLNAEAKFCRVRGSSSKEISISLNLRYLIFSATNGHFLSVCAVLSKLLTIQEYNACVQSVA